LRPLDNLQKACDYLIEKDSLLNRIILPKISCSLFEPKLIDEDYLFFRLARSVVGQQLSTTAANTIWSRIDNSKSEHQSLQYFFLSLNQEEAVTLGLSRQKFSYIKNMATLHHNSVLKLCELDEFDDDTVIEILTKLPGIGQWTSEMFLMSCLKRMDIFSLGDAGLRNAVSLLYNIEKNDLDKIQLITKNWRPFRSVASCYLWNALDNQLLFPNN
jgi:DNA-3-methyladenine glycosylase II